MSDQHPHDPTRPQEPYQQPSHDPASYRPGSYDPASYQPHPPSYGAAPVQPMSPEQERSWGAIAHGAALAAMVLSAGFLGFFGSLAVFLLHKDRGPFVRSHAANSLNVQITMFIWLVISVPLVLALGLGIITFIAAPFVAGLLHLVGTIKAYNGEWWNPPLTPRFIS